MEEAVETFHVCIDLICDSLDPILGGEVAVESGIRLVDYVECRLNAITPTSGSC
jgi:hypothetical protein